MKRNYNGHVLRSLTNRVMAVIDDERRTQTAVETLERAGIADRELATFEGEEGVQQVDAEGVHSGVITLSMSVCSGAGSVTQSCRFSVPAAPTL